MNNNNNKKRAHSNLNDSNGSNHKKEKLEIMSSVLSLYNCNTDSAFEKYKVCFLASEIEFKSLFIMQYSNISECFCHSLILLYFDTFCFVYDRKIMPRA